MSDCARSYSLADCLIGSRWRKFSRSSPTFNSPTPIVSASLTLRTIRSLLKDGLMQIGELSGPDGTFPAWEPIDEAMDRLHERFVDHYAEPASWDYSIWLGLTEAGLPVAKALRAG